MKPPGIGRSNHRNLQSGLCLVCCCHDNHVIDVCRPHHMGKQVRGTFVPLIQLEWILSSWQIGIQMGPKYTFWVHLCKFNRQIWYLQLPGAESHPVVHNLRMASPRTEIINICLHVLNSTGYALEKSPILNAKLISGDK